jgi:hypothetical protein
MVAAAAEAESALEHADAAFEDGSKAARFAKHRALLK